MAKSNLIAVHAIYDRDKSGKQIVINPGNAFSTTAVTKKRLLEMGAAKLATEPEKEAIELIENKSGQTES